MSHESSCVLLVAAVWPEPRSSAAGVRTRQLIDSIRKYRPAWRVVVHSPAPANPHRDALLSDEGVQCFSCEPNDPDFDRFVAELRPDWVIFDRFMMEEQFGWRVREHAPSAIRILDTIDLHFVRRYREHRVLREGCDPDEPIDFLKIPVNQERDQLRELASILRCDRTWVVSSFEQELLRSSFGFTSDTLHLLRWGQRMGTEQGGDPAVSRDHFCMIGNFIHAPNRDSVRWVVQELWPEIRQRLPEARLRVVGAYPSREDLSVNNPRSGVEILGAWNGDAIDWMAGHRVLLAPLRFGAGIKGKILDAWSAGVAVLTSPVGAEGMVAPETSFPGVVVPIRSKQEWVARAVELYQRVELRSNFAERGRAALASEYGIEQWALRLIDELENLRARVQDERPKRWLSRVLAQQERDATRWMSKWIEAKNRKL